MKKVIVTGAGGFLGYALSRRLSSQGVSVFAVVREGGGRNDGGLRQLEHVSVVECSLEHMHRLAQFIPHQQYDAFYHFAWEGVADDRSSSLPVQLANVQHACDAVYAASSVGADRFVFASSIMEYEVMKLMHTTQYADPRNAYRTAKLAAHYFTRVAAGSAGIIYNAAVISNVYGAGEFSERFISSTIRGMLRGERVSFTDAKQKYDFVYIRSCCHFH